MVLSGVEECWKRKKIALQITVRCCYLSCVRQSPFNDVNENDRLYDD